MENDEVIASDPARIYFRSASRLATSLGPGCLSPTKLVVTFGLIAVAAACGSSTQAPARSSTDVIANTQTALPVACRTLAKGTTATCAVGGDGRVSCWGTGWDKIFSSNDDLRAVAIPGLASIEGVAVGLMHACAWSAAQLQCWGEGMDGELGVGAIKSSVVPLTVPVGDVVFADVSQSASCALTSSGKVWCWGVLGDHDIGNTPRQVALRGHATTFDIDEQGGCALMDDGTVQCWVDPASVVAIAGLPRIVDVAADEALSDRGELWWWVQRPDERTDLTGQHADPGIFAAYEGGSLGCVIDRAGAVSCFGPECGYPPPPPGTSSRDRLRLDFGGPVDAIVNGRQQEVCARRRDGSWSCASCNDHDKLTFAPPPFVPRTCR